MWRVGHDTGAATSIAGNGAEPCPVPVADGPRAADGCLGDLYAIAVDPAGDVLLSTLGTIRRVDAVDGTITTLAGRPTPPSGYDPCCEGCTLPPECVRATDLAL